MAFFFKQKTLPGWLAVKAEGERAQFAYVRPGEKRPQVVYCEARAIDPADPRALERAGREFDAHRHRVTTLMAPRDYQLLVVEAPTVKAEELRSAIRWRIKDMIDFHVDDAVIDVLDIPVARNGATRGHSMAAVVSRTAAVQGIVARFEAAKLPLEVIDIPDTAQRNVAALFESAERGVVTLSFDADGGLITFTSGGELYLARRIDLAVGQLAAAEETARAPAFERALVEMQRSLDHFERQFRDVTVGKVLLAPMPQPAESLRAYLRENLYLPVEELALESVVDLPATRALADRANQMHWLKLVGAGLRSEAKAL